MIEWHNERLSYSDLPDNVSVYLVGTTRISKGILNTRLDIRFERGSEKIKVTLREKDAKIWPVHHAYDIDETILVQKYNSWIDKFHKTTNSFKSIVLKAASKADVGTATWILSLSDIKRSN
jgi:hypothetical protein